MSAPIRWNPSSSTSSSAMSAWNFIGKNTQKMMLAVSDTPVKSTVLPVVSNMRRMATSKPVARHQLLHDARQHVVAVVDADADADGGDRQRVDVEVDAEEVHHRLGQRLRHQRRQHDDERADHRDVGRVAQQEHDDQDEDQVHAVGPLHLFVHRGEDADQAAGEPVAARSASRPGARRCTAWRARSSARSSRGCSPCRRSRRSRSCSSVSKKRSISPRRVFDVSRKKSCAMWSLRVGRISHLGSPSWKVRKIFLSSVVAVTVPPTSGCSRHVAREEVEVVERVGVLDRALALHALLARRQASGVVRAGSACTASPSHGLPALRAVRGALGDDHELARAEELLVHLA